MITNNEKKLILAFRKLKVSLPKIGAYFGLHHSSVMYHVQNPERLAQTRNGKNKSGRMPDPSAISKPIIKEALAIVADPNYLPTLLDTPNLGGLPRKLGRGKWPRNLPTKKVPIQKTNGKTYAERVAEQKVFTRDDIGNIILVSEPKTKPKFHKFTREWL